MLAERLFAMQSTSAPQLGRATGGTPQWTPAIAAAFCAGNMDQRWYDAARLKYSLDWSTANALEYAVWLEAALIANREKWKIPTGREYIRKMAGLAIAEMAEPRRYRYDVIKTAWLGCDPAQWTKVWGKRYNAVFAIPNDWASEALRHVEKRLADI